MIKNSHYKMGVISALLAALSNGTIGLFTNFGIRENLNPSAISFYRCLIAFVAVSFFLLLTEKQPTKIIFSFRVGVKIAVCAFFGIFLLYFFETLAYSYLPVSNVAFLLMASSAILTFILGEIFLKEKITLIKLTGLAIVMLGILIMVLETNNYRLHSLIGMFLAIMAGVGYSSFLILIRKFKLNSSLRMLWGFFGIGMVYLAIPFFMDHPKTLTISVLPILLLLGIIPTLGGFYFTTKSLQYLEANKTQLLELTEPIFASLLALLFLDQGLSVHKIIGGALIIIGVFVSERKKVLPKKTINMERSGIF